MRRECQCQVVVEELVSREDVPERLLGRNFGVNHMLAAEETQPRESSLGVAV